MNNFWAATLESLGSIFHLHGFKGDEIFFKGFIISEVGFFKIKYIFLLPFGFGR